MPKKVRLIDIAQKTGVSVGTVSYVLNNANVSISKEVRERVWAAANELHYTTNWAAKGLKLQHNNAIGVIVEDMKSWYVSRLIDGICDYAEEMDVRVLLCNLRADDKVHDFGHEDLSTYEEQIAKQVRTTFGNQVDGLLYIGAFKRDVSKVFVPENEHIVYVYCYCGDSDQYPSVCYSDVQGAAMATQYLIDKGHRQIAYLDGLFDTKPGLDRQQGFRDTLMEHGISIPEAWFVSPKNGDVRQFIEELIRKPNRPTAIFCNMDCMAAVVYDVCKDCDVRIPEDISIIGFDNAELCKYLRPELTSIGFPAAKIGYQAAKILCEEPKATGMWLLDCEVFERKSVCTLN